MCCSGRRSKQRIQGQLIIFEGKGSQGWNKNILLLYFPYWPESQKSCVFALTWYINLFFCWTVISHQSFSSFPSTSVGALGLFTFLPQSTIHNLRTSELGVPVHSSLMHSCKVHMLYGVLCLLCINCYFVANIYSITIYWRRIYPGPLVVKINQD